MRAFLAALLLLQLLEAADLHKATKFTAESDLTELEKATSEPHTPPQPPHNHHHHPPLPPPKSSGEKRTERTSL